MAKHFWGEGYQGNLSMLKQKAVAVDISYMSRFEMRPGFQQGTPSCHHDGPIKAGCGGLTDDGHCRAVQPLQYSVFSVHVSFTFGVENLLWQVGP